jgi:hypothetical protein
MERGGMDRSGMFCWYYQWLIGATKLP